MRSAVTACGLSSVGIAPAQGIEEPMGEIYDEAERSGTTSLAAAYALARRRLTDAGTELR